MLTVLLMVLVFNVGFVMGAYWKAAHLGPDEEQ